MYLFSYSNSALVMFLIFGWLGVVAQETACANGIDDDQDGFIDCGDTDCVSAGACDDAYVCTNTLYQVISSSLKKLDPVSGTYVNVGDAPANYNGAGYNVQDGYIYGIRSATDGMHLWKVDASGAVDDLGLVEGFSGRSYVGDFDEHGHLYTYQSGSSAYLSYIDVDADQIRSIKQQITSLSGTTPASADITYNPIFKKFFGLDARNTLFFLDPISLTSEILGDFSAQIDVTGSFGAAWSDIEGSSYFANNKTGKIFKFVFDSDGTVLSVTHVSTGQPTNSNDGMGCFYSLPPFETSCDDGIDNDGDGYIDCEDPDCANTGSCPRIDISLRSLDIAGPHSIIPVHITCVNNSQVDAYGISIVLNLPDGFSYISDTVEVLGNANYDKSAFPIEKDTSVLRWNGFDMPVGDTIVLSMSLLVDPNLSAGLYEYQVNCQGVLSLPDALVHEVVIDQLIYTNPQPYDCEPSVYQVYKKRGEPNVFGKLDPHKGTYEEIAIINPQANGLGFDVASGFAYGTDGKKFIRMDQEGNVSYLDLEFNKKVYVGDVDTLSHWVGKVGTDLVVVDLSTYQIDEVIIDQGMPGWDMAYNKDGNFYAVHKDQLYKHDTKTKLSSHLGSLTGDAIELSGHGAQWTGADGYHYISNNATGNIYRIDIPNQSAALCMVAEKGLQYNDGFACPTELVPVFSYDYGDLQLFPVARQLVYEQDLSEDGVPDYNMVWLGEQVTHEILDPSNADATGDDAEDGIFVPAEVVPDGELKIDMTISSNSLEQEAHWGVWIDWDMDGEYDSFKAGAATVSSVEYIKVDVSVPSDYAGDRYALRVRVTSKEVLEEHFVGDILEPGEVEDYIFSSKRVELCSNGLDDDKNGLMDCDDPACVDTCKFNPTSPGDEGGLESNGDLISQIAKTMYQRSRQPEFSKRPQRFDRSKNNTDIEEMTLSNLIPDDAIPNTTAYVTSPEHLIGITNAIDLFAVDIYKSDDRVGVALLLDTKEAVYEHTKYVCDRLSGSSIEDIYQFKIDGINDFIITKIKNREGHIEYSTSFSLRAHHGGDIVLESHWDLADYPSSSSYTNIQLWANNTHYLIEMCLNVLGRAKLYHDIVDYNIGQTPEVYIKSGQMATDSLTLIISNKLELDYLNCSGYVSYSETKEQEAFSYKLDLTGAIVEEVNIPTQYAYYMGFSILHEEIATPDIIFAAQGAWGYSADAHVEDVDIFEIVPGGSSDSLRYNVHRSIVMAGSVSDYISVYRSFTPRFEGIDVSNYNALTFKGKGSARIEIVMVSASESDWRKQSKYVVELTEDERQYVLGQTFFKNEDDTSASWEDLSMLVINIIGDGLSRQQFDLQLSDFSFGWSEEEAPYLVTTEAGIVGPGIDKHSAHQSDHTFIDSVIMKADMTGQIIKIKVENKTTESLYVEDLILNSDESNFRVELFAPQVLLEGETYIFNIVYMPRTWPDQAIANVILYISSGDRSDEINIELIGNSYCVDHDYIRTDNISQDRQKFKAKSTISSDAAVSSSHDIELIAKQNIELKRGFEVSAGGQLKLIANDHCQE